MLESENFSIRELELRKFKSQIASTKLKVINKDLLAEVKLNQVISVEQRLYSVTQCKEASVSLVR